MTERRPALAKKTKQMEALASILKAYKTILIIDSSRVRTNLINDMRLTFDGRVLFKYVKPNVLKRATTQIGDASLIEFANKHSFGTIILALTNEDPFKVTNEFRRNSMQLRAKSGDVAQSDIVVEPMNTGLAPGPVISELNEAGLPTRIETGSVWITKRTTVAKAGEVISPRKAAALSKIGMKPIRLYLAPKAAFSDKIEIMGSILKIEPSEVYEGLSLAADEALLVSLDIFYFSDKTIPVLLSKAAMVATSLAIATDYPSVETIEPLIQKARAEVKLLESSIGAT